MKLEHTHTLCRKANSEWLHTHMQDGNHKAPGREHSKAFSDAHRTQVFLGRSPRATEIKTKTSKWDLTKLKHFCTARKTTDKMKTTHGMEENSCKQCYWQGLNFQNIQTAHLAQNQKNKQPNHKNEQRLKQTFLQRRHTDGQQTDERCSTSFIIQFSSVVSNSLWPHEPQHEASLSITNSQSLLKLMSIESVMTSSHLILCRPLLLLPPIPPSIRVFSNESTLRIRWPKYWSFSFNINPSNENPGLISFRMDWLDLLAVQGTLKSLLQHHSSKASILWCSAFFTLQFSHPYMTTGKTIALTRQIFVGKVMSLLFN